jgi:hypothetical protein
MMTNSVFRRCVATFPFIFEIDATSDSSIFYRYLERFRAYDELRITSL